MNDFDYDVALSFAGEDRAIAQAIAEGLHSRKIRVFYDEFEESNLWGKNLYDHLADVYSRRAAFCLMILSRNYAGKTWTTHERRHAQARAFNENREYILPLKLDDTQIPGIEPTLGYVDYRETSVDKVVDLLESKLSAIRAGNAEQNLKLGCKLDLHTSILNLGLSEAGLRIIAEKGDGWECKFFLEILREEMESARSMKLDLQYGFVGQEGRYFEILEFFRWAATQSELIGRQVEAFRRLANEGLQAALAQGEEGDPASICLIARKMGALYKWAAEWGIGFRSVLVNDDFATLLNLYAKSALILMEGIEELHRGLKSSFDYWCGLDEEEKTVHKARVEVTLEFPNTEKIGDEIKRLQKLYGWK